MLKQRKFYLLAMPLTLISGLAARHFAPHLPAAVNLYLGDALWALLVYFLLRFIAPQLSIFLSALLALCFSYGIEISQLYHAPWIDALRATTLGGLVLGFGFLWTDIVAYTLGVLAGLLLEKLK